MRTKIKIIITDKNNFTYEYRGVDMNDNEKQLFKNTLTQCTRGATTFIGAIHALMYIKQNQLYGDVYIDNEYIKKSIEEKTYNHTPIGDKALLNFRKSKMWLLEQKSNINIELYK